MPSFRDEIREAVSSAGPLGSGEYSALEGPWAQKLARSLLLALQAPQNSLRWRLAVWRLSRKSWLIDTESFDIEPIQALCLQIVRQRKGDPRLANLSRRLVGKGQSPVPKLLLTTIAQATANTSGTVMIEFGDPIRIHYDEAMGMEVPASLARALFGACRLAEMIGYETYRDAASDTAIPAKGRFKWESDDRFVVELG